jgi:hypothetical protein
MNDSVDIDAQLGEIEEAYKPSNQWDPFEIALKDKHYYLIGPQTRTIKDELNREHTVP